jgi:hypothetical protein
MFENGTAPEVAKVIFKAIISDDNAKPDLRYLVGTYIVRYY